MQQAQPQASNGTAPVPPRGAETTGKRDFRVAIVGGGMCGVPLAIMLAKAGVEVDVFESHGEFGAVGASVTIGANALKALSLMGLLDTICESTGQYPALNRMVFTLNTTEGEELIYREPEDDSEPRDMSLHRAAFLAALTPLLPSKHVHFNKRCTDITHCASSDTYQVHFDDCSYHEADLVIGTDGIKSVVRRVVVQGVGEFPQCKDSLGKRLKEDENLMFTGCRLYRSLVPYETLRKDGLTQEELRMKNRIGKNSNIFTIPIKGGSLISVAAYSDMRSPVPGEHTPPLPPPWVVKEVPNEDMRKRFQDWDEGTNVLLRNMGTSSYWALHSMGKYLDTFVRGRIVLVGDAGHASTPFLGAGVGQGIEDIYLLWTLLSDPRACKKNIPAIFKAYDTIRVPRANYVIKASGDIPDLIYNAVTDPSHPKDKRQELIDDLRRTQAEIKKHDVEGDGRRAVEWLVKEGHF